MVVRESMSADLLERLISDIVAVTERLVDSDPVDLSSLQIHPNTVEKSRSRYRRHGQQQHDQPRSRLGGMGEGIHKSVC